MRYPRVIYSIKHNITNRVYIGSSSVPKKRIQSHLAALRGGYHSVEDMQADFNAYGDDYTISIIEEIGYEQRNKEYEWIGFYNSNIRGVGYNYKDWVANYKLGRAV